MITKYQHSIFRMKGVKLYDAKARKRDLDEWKLEKQKTVDKYFDKWSKITSRFCLFFIVTQVISNLI